MKKDTRQYTFTVITAAYNAEKYIAKCIWSVIKNKYSLKNVEHIVVDDGSTDNTAKIVKSLARRFKHIKFYQKQNGNWGSVMNYVRDNKLIHNDYVVICDSDDILARTAFYNANKCIKDADVAIGGFYFWNGRHRRFPMYPYYRPFKRMDVPYQDIPLFFWAQRNAKIIANIPHIMGSYWSIRPNNTMSKTSQIPGKNFQTFLENMHYLEAIDEPTFAFLYLLRVPKFFDLVKQQNIKFTFHSKPSVKIIPWIFRWITRLVYLTKVKKYFIIKKEEN